MTVKMGAPMPPNPMMPQQPLNPLPRPMPVPPINPNMQFGQQPVGALPAAAGTFPVNKDKRKRFGDSLETMLSRPPMVASDQMAGMNVFTGQMPRRQMMGGTAMQPPVRRMMGGGPVPRRTDIYGQDHMLAYIRPDEADLLMGLGGAGTPGPGGIPQFGIRDFFSSIFGGGKKASSSSPSYSKPSNDPYAENRPSTSQSSADAGRQYAESMIAGGGGTNLSGSGSNAMEKLLAAQQAQTQKDDGPPPDVTASSYTPGSVISSYENQENSFAQRKADEIRAAQEAQAAAEAEMGLDIFGGAGPDVTPTTNTGVVGGYDTLGIGSSDDPFYTPPPDFTIDDTPPSDITGSFSSPGDLNFLDPSVLYYDIDGVPHNTEAEQQAANRLINQRIERQQEEQRIAQAAADEAARTQAEAAAREQRLRDERTAAASSGMNPLTAYGGMSYPESEDAFLGVGPIDLTDPRGDEANTMTNYLTDPIADPMNTGLGDKSLDKKVTDAAEETDDRNFIQKFIDDIKDVPGNIVSDVTMALDAGLFGSYEKMIENLKNAKNPDGSRKYTDEQIDKYIADTKETQRKQREKQERESAQDDDDGPTSVVDPCPEGFKLDPASGICVPVEEDDTEEDEDSGDDKEEDTSDDELSGVVRTPPPPTSYLDNPIKMIDNPLRMNKGGSVGLNRAADNFLAAMGA